MRTSLKRSLSKVLLCAAALAGPMAPASARADAPAATPTAAASIPQTPIGFSKLIVRIEGDDSIGMASFDQHVRILEHMRQRGFHAVGAEDLVFGKDESASARFLLGGTVREVECKSASYRTTSCRIGVEWALLDVASDRVVYKKLSRAVFYDADPSRKQHIAQQLIDLSVDSLLKREAFRKAIATEGAAATDPTFPAATMARCAPAKRLAEGADDFLDRVVVVKTADGFGSGVFVSPEGLVLTAGHVVTGGPMKILTRDGKELEAVAVRVAQKQDMALIRTKTPLGGQKCAALRADGPPTGSEAYAAGAPASLDLAFSLTRGIVSGYPIIEGKRRLQTDAPVSPGNSGGPIVDPGGAVLGIVSFKVVSTKVEGLAFAVPTAEVLATLGLKVDDATSPALETEAGPITAPMPAAAFVDLADGMPTLDHDTARREAAARREEARRDETGPGEVGADAKAPKELREPTPLLKPALLWGGVTLAFAGSMILVSSLEGDDSSTRTVGAVGWTALGVGAAGIVGSFFVHPPQKATTGPTAPSVSIGPGRVTVGGSF